MKKITFDNKKFAKEMDIQGWTVGKLAERLARDYNPKASKALVHAWKKQSTPSSVYLMAVCKILNKNPDFFAH